MPVNSKVDIFTTAMKTQFLTAYEATAKPAPWEDFTQVIPSDARIEHYTWMTPSPGIGQWTGHRRYGKLDTTRYSVQNLEFDAAFEVLLRDIQDDQVGGYALKPKELTERAKKFPGRWVVKHLAAGKTRTCFDGSAFFADSHSIGTGDNLMAKDCASNDGATYKLAALFTGGVLKPLIWQARKAPDFQTNAGTPQSTEAKMVRYWIDMEGEAAYGWWWNAILVEIQDTPTVTEMHDIFADIEKRFRTFQLPKALTSDDGEYPFEQEVFSQENLHLVGSTGLSEVLRQALNQDWAPQTIAGGNGSNSQTVATTNRFRGFANWSVSAFMNT